MRLAYGMGMVAAALLIGGASARTQGEPVYTTPLGIALETWEYPYPVRYLPLEVEGQAVRMAYMDVPPQEGGGRTVVVLLHGKNFFGGYWANTIRALTAAGHRVVVPDQIGFGKSSKPDIAYSFDLLAASTARLLDELKIERAAIVGHSMGGMLAVRFARNYPERASHLVLENPIGLEDYRFTVPPRATEAVFADELKQTTEKVRAYFKTYPAVWKPEVFEPYVEAQSRVTRSGEYPRWAMASARTYQMIYQQPVRHEFGLLRTPTLLVIGQEDRTAVGKAQAPEAVRKTLGQYPRLGKAAARDIPGSRLVELDGVGHIPHLEAPDRFHAALRDFIK